MALVNGGPDLLVQLFGASSELQLYPEILYVAKQPITYAKNMANS